MVYTRTPIRHFKRKKRNEENIINREKSLKEVTRLCTFIITIAALIFSASQLFVALISKSKEIKISSDQWNKEIELKKIENERQWNLDVTSFITSHRDIIFSNNIAERKKIRDVMFVTFPPNITNALFEKINLTEPDSIWSTGKRMNLDYSINSWTGVWSFTEQIIEGAFSGKLELRIIDPNTLIIEGECDNKYKKLKTKLKGQILSDGQVIAGRWTNPSSGKSGRFKYTLISPTYFEGNYSMGNNPVDIKKNKWVAFKQ